MLIHQTMEKLAEMKLSGFLAGLRDQMDNPQYQDLSFEERLGLLVDKEYLGRENRRLTRRLREAQLRLQAEIEDVDFQLPRGLDKTQLLTLAEGSWIHHHHNLIITGPTGGGKTFLACALANKACREGFSTFYSRAPRLYYQLAISKADGNYTKLMTKLAKTHLLVIDDLGLAPMTDSDRRNLLEVIEDRHTTGSTILTSQLPFEHWHENIGDPTIADAILDRLIHKAHRINLKGDSIRKKSSDLTQSDTYEKK